MGISCQNQKLESIVYYLNETIGHLDMPLEADY